MAIRFTKYVDIVSGVGGGAAVRQRDLIGRLFTTNPLLPTKSIAEFDTEDDVGAYFGTSSEEYLRALFYFGWISKNITKAQKISFARWVDASVAPRIYGVPKDQAVATWNSITAGTFSLEMGGDTQVIGPIDFSLAASLSAVASLIQAQINAETGTLWTDAVLTYDPVRRSFNFVGGEVGPATISVTAGAGGSDIAGQLGWLTGAILSDGAATESVVDVLTESTDASNNFGSFLFMPALSIEELELIGAWNATQNILFQFMVRTPEIDSQDYYDALKDFPGIAMTLSEISGEWPEMIPMIILAATAYEKRNSVQNYMFQIFAVTPSVTTTQKSNDLDDIRINYYGRTQTAGQFLDFYQRGVLTGLPAAPVDQNVYANEQWLKDAAAAQIMELLLSLPRVSANSEGRSQLMTTLQSVIDRALFNGTISVGKPLNNTQKLFIGQVTGDDLAWHQVQNIGYWLDCVMESYVTQDGRTEWKAVYALVYSEDDAIRKVEGQHILI